MKHKNNTAPHVALRRLVLALRRWRRKHLRTMSEAGIDMVDEFKRDFPGKCMICSYHRFGRDHGMTTEPKPAPHDCIDRQNNALSQTHEI